MFLQISSFLKMRLGISWTITKIDADIALDYLWSAAISEILIHTTFFSEGLKVFCTSLDAFLLIALQDGMAFITQSENTKNKKG